MSLYEDFLSERGKTRLDIFCRELDAIDLSTKTLEIEELKCNNLNVLSYNLNESHLKSWAYNKGTPAAKGPDGDIGATGLDGEQGLRGLTGAKGVTGSVGLKGVKGVKGLQGYSGERGDVGELGDRGIQGPVGPKGMDGPIGEEGTTVYSYIDSNRYGQVSANAANAIKMFNYSTLAVLDNPHFNVDLAPGEDFILELDFNETSINIKDGFNQPNPMIVNICPSIHATETNLDQLRLDCYVCVTGGYKFMNGKMELHIINPLVYKWGTTDLPNTKSVNILNMKILLLLALDINGASSNSLFKSQNNVNSSVLGPTCKIIHGDLIYGDSTPNADN